MRLLIDTEDRKNRMYPLPWSSDGTCFNFKTPTKMIYPNTTIRNPEKVETLVINCDLSSYDFISQMVNLTQLYIYKGKNILHLSFLKELVKLRQLCVLDSHVASLKSLIELIELKYKRYKEMPEEEAFIGRLTFAFEGVCIQSDAYKGDGRELIKSDICNKDILINENRITFKEITKNPEYKKLLFRN